MYVQLFTRKSISFLLPLVLSSHPCRDASSSTLGAPSDTLDDVQSTQGRGVRVSQYIHAQRVEVVVY